jgi:hypothetical protein
VSTLYRREGGGGGCGSEPSDRAAARSRQAPRAPARSLPRKRGAEFSARAPDDANSLWGLLTSQNMKHLITIFLGKPNPQRRLQRCAVWLAAECAFVSRARSRMRLL